MNMHKWNRAWMAAWLSHQMDRHTHSDRKAHVHITHTNCLHTIQDPNIHNSFLIIATTSSTKNEQVHNLTNTGGYFPYFLVILYSFSPTHQYTPTWLHYVLISYNNQWLPISLQEYLWNKCQHYWQLAHVCHSYSKGITSQEILSGSWANNPTMPENNLCWIG